MWKRESAAADVKNADEHHQNCHREVREGGEAGGEAGPEQALEDVEETSALHVREEVALDY